MFLASSQDFHSLIDFFHSSLSSHVPVSQQLLSSVLSFSAVAAVFRHFFRVSSISLLSARYRRRWRFHEAQRHSGFRDARLLT